jgi:fructokinase
MILVIGEALIDLIGRSSDEGRYQAVVGGANANVALALAVRGEKQAFLGRISTDGFGQQIRNHLTSHGVNLEHSVVASEKTTLAVATIDNQGVASYSFYTKDTADWGWQPQELPSLDKLAELGVTTIQYGCLGMAIGPGNKVIEGWLREVSNQTDITLSHDLNIRPALGFSRDAELERVLSINTISDIIKASDADIEWLYGLREGEDLDEIAYQWSQGKLVLITRGPAGVSIYRDGQRIDVPGQKVALVDTVGAGDTFMATFLAELGKLGALGGASGAKLAGLSDAQLVEAARISTIAAGIVCERVGCQPPTSEEIAVRS